MEHRDATVDHDGERAVGYPVMRQIIQVGCRTAIKLAERYKALIKHDLNG